MARSPKSAKPADDQPAPEAPVEATEGAASKSDAIKMKDFLGRVAAASGGKRKGAREATEAVLAALAEVLKNGESFALPPLGRGRVVKSADGTVTLKLRLGGAPKAKAAAEKEALAEDGE